MNSRRKFISVSGVVVGGVALGGLHAEGIGQTTAEEDVLAVVAKYGSAKTIKRQSGKTETIEVQVNVASLEAMADAFVGPQGVPFEQIYASGNTMTFEHKGTAFRLENTV